MRRVFVIIAAGIVTFVAAYSFFTAVFFGLVGDPIVRWLWPNASSYTSLKNAMGGIGRVLFACLSAAIVLEMLGLLSPISACVPGTCRKCGYDLTGNTSGRCPECGTDIEST